MHMSTSHAIIKLEDYLDQHKISYFDNYRLNSPNNVHLDLFLPDERLGILITIKKHHLFNTKKRQQKRHNLYQEKITYCKQHAIALAKFDGQNWDKVIQKIKFEAHPSASF